MLALGFGVDITAVVAEAIGRDPTLTDRTKIWSFLLNMKTQSAPWHRLRELLARSSAPVVLAACRPRAHQ